MEREIIVAGAGPAGAATAIVLAQKGHDVLLLDRQPFPRDKVCGDGIPTGTIEKMMALGMGERIETAVAQGQFYPIRHLSLTSPKGIVLKTDLKKGNNGAAAYIAPRIYFDHVLQQHAIACGAEFGVAQVKEPLVENGRVFGVKVQASGRVEEIRARIVVGADGATSVIARGLRGGNGRHPANHRAVAIRAYIRNFVTHPHEVEFYLYDEVLPGYAWIFPTADTAANIGLGMRLDIFRREKHNLKKMLDNFLRIPFIRERLLPGWTLENQASWQLNFGSQKGMQYAFDGALLVGDAAGFINPLTGGGIDNALVSAELAAQTIAEALVQGDTSRAALQIYEQRCHAALWSGMRSSYFIQKWVLRFPSLVDFLIKHMKVENPLVQTFLSKL